MMLVAPQTEKSKEEVDEFLAGTKKLMDVIQFATKNGSLLAVEVAPVLETIGSVAGVVKDLIGMVEPPADDPVIKTLGELKNQLTSLSEQITNQFDDLKAFELEKSFDEAYNVPLGKLFLFMTDTLTKRGKEAVEHFETAYKEVNPQTVVYDMMSRLSQDFLNPLKKAMEADPLMTDATFDKWLNILLSVCGQALLLEQFARGLLKKDDYDTKRILEKNAELDEMLRKWDNEYVRNTANWWPKKIEQFVHTIQDDSDLDGNEKKMDKLWKGLQSIKTNDSFYAVCFKNGLTWHIDKPKADQVIQSEDRAGYNIIVYRSPLESWNNKYKEALDDKKLNASFGTIGETTGAEADRWFTKSRFNKIGDELGEKGLFLGVRSGDVATRSSQREGWKLGPGYYTYDKNVSIINQWAVESSHFPLFFLVAL